MQLFSCFFMVPQPDLRLERSRYMSRHLVQTGPNMTIGNRSWFYQTEKEANVPGSSVFICTSHGAAWFRLSQVRWVCGSGVNRSRSDSGSLPCHEHQRFITSALLHHRVFFLLTLFSYSSKGPPLLASSSHAQVHFSDFSTVF